MAQIMETPTVLGLIKVWCLVMKIIRTTATLPPIIVIHGQPGIGKTTLAQNFPNPIFVQTEDGCPAGLEIETFGLRETFTGVVEALMISARRP